MIIVWVNHMLRPSMYRNDCKKLLGEVIDHSIHLRTMYLSMNKKNFLKLTRKLYEDEFKEPYCDDGVIEAQQPVLIQNTEDIGFTFELPPQPQEVPVHPIFTKEVGSVEGAAIMDSKVSLKVNDLLMDAGWITDFTAYMSKCLKNPAATSQITCLDDPDEGTEYTNSCHLSTFTVYHNILKSYERFLYMVAKYPPETGYLHPTYAIDVMWHAHMICPKLYDSDIARLVGFSIDHDPWPTCSKKDMDENTQHSQDLWQKEYGNPLDLDHQMTVAGGYRGYILY